MGLLASEDENTAGRGWYLRVLQARAETSLASCKVEYVETAYSGIGSSSRVLSTARADAHEES